MHTHTGQRQHICYTLQYNEIQYSNANDVNQINQSYYITICVFFFFLLLYSPSVDDTQMVDNTSCNETPVLIYFDSRGRQRNRAATVALDIT